MGDQMVLAYSMMGRSNVLYVVMSFLAFSPVLMWELNVFCFCDSVICVGEELGLGFKSKAKDGRAGGGGDGSVVDKDVQWFIIFWGTGIMRVDLVLVGLICRLLLWARVCISLRYGRRFWMARLVGWCYGDVVCVDDEVEWVDFGKWLVWKVYVE